MPKPLVRWIVGPVFPNGFKCVALGFKKMRSIYGDDLEYLICHNQLNERQVAQVEAIGCPTWKQEAHHFAVPPTDWPEDVGSLLGTRCAWKLYPPRLRPDAHEVILDNDIIIRGRLKTLEAFLEGDKPLLSQGRKRNYGHFDPLIPQGLVYNNGIIGLPPGLDFEARLKQNLPAEWEWSYFFDDQGLVVLSLHDLQPLVIGFDEVSICAPGDTPPDVPGLHFVGLNSNLHHGGWMSYLKASGRSLLS